MQQLPESQSPYQNTTSFIARLIQAAVSKQDPQLRLAMLTSLWVDIRTMENMYGLNASELAASIVTAGTASMPARKASA